MYWYWYVYSIGKQTHPLSCNGLDLSKVQAGTGWPRPPEEVPSFKGLLICVEGYWKSPSTLWGSSCLLGMNGGHRRNVVTYLGALPTSRFSGATTRRI